MNLNLREIDLAQIIFELLRDLAIMYTIINLFLQKFTANSLDRRRPPLTLNGKGLVCFCLLAGSSMLLKIDLPPVEGIQLDLRLAILTLAGAYLGLTSATLVALFTVMFRFFLGGVGWVWWAAGALFYGPIAYLITRFLPFGRLNIAIAALANVVVFMGTLALLSLFLPGFRYYSPLTAPATFWEITLVEMLIIPLATVILDWTFKDSLAYHRNYSDLKEKANLDGMTGLINHRRFQELLGDLLAKADADQPTTVLMIDIDHFKRYNDALGHQAGDVLLRELGGILTVNVRAGDIVARYGGEEFIVILPDTPESIAAVIAERLRAAVANHPFAGREKMAHGKLTVSIGLASQSGAAVDKNALIAAADSALYAAKKAGRNLVKVYDGSLAAETKEHHP